MKNFPLLFFACILSITCHWSAQSLFPESTNSPEGFKFGVFYIDKSHALEKNLETVQRTLALCVISDLNYWINLASQLFIKFYGQSLREAGANGSYSDEIIAISNDLNTCSIQLSMAQQSSNTITEVLLQASLLFWPLNYASVKNYAYILEYSGATAAARSLFTDCAFLTDEVGCAIHAAITTPFVQTHMKQGEVTYLRDLQKLFQLIRKNPKSFTPEESMRFHQQNEALNIIRALPFNAQYLGYAPSMLFELLSLSLTSNFPALEDEFIIPRETSNSIKTVERKKIRVGVVSEQLGNTSPGLCMHYILPFIPQLFPDIELVFFDRPGLITVFADYMKEASVSSPLLNPDDLHYSRQQIIHAQVDILLYLALPTDKLSYFLAHQRLAPVQVALGLGHPLSSGLRSIDFSVIPESMLFEGEEVSRLLNRKLVSSSGPVTALSCAFEAYYCSDDIILAYEEARDEEERRKELNQIYLHHTHLLPQSEKDSFSLLRQCSLSSSCFERSSGAADGSFLYYTEQVVRFRTLGHYIENPINIYRSTYETSATRILHLVQQYLPLDELEFFQLKSDLQATEGLESLSKEQSLPSMTKRLLKQRQLQYPLYISIAPERLSHHLPSLNRTVSFNILPFEESEIQALGMGYSLTCEELDFLLTSVDQNFPIPEQFDAYLLEFDQLQKSLRQFNNASRIKNHRSHNKSKHQWRGITATSIGCYSLTEERLYLRQHEYYNAIQHLKKYHPAFDDAICEIIYQDRAKGRAKIVVKEGVRFILPRILNRCRERGLVMTSQQFQRSFVFAPGHLNHFNYLILLGLSSVFLNPFPFGSGITSFEAVIMNLPTVTLTSDNSILSFHLAQLLELFPIDEYREKSDDVRERHLWMLKEVFLAPSLTAYVKQAIGIATGRIIRGHTLRTYIQQQKYRLLRTELIEEVIREWGSFFQKVSNTL